MLTYAAISPHPPLIIPDIGEEQLQGVQATVEGLKQVARQLVESCPDTVVFLTPHGNVFADALSSLSAPYLAGNLSSFGSSQSWTGLPNDLEFLREVSLQAVDQGISFVAIDEDTALNHRLNPHLDHGILVPLYYLREAGLQNVRVVPISIGFISLWELYRFGLILQQTASRLKRRLAVVASGDLSHRLKSEGPYNYHPDGPVFDQTIYNLLKTGDFEGIMKIPTLLRENAGECGYRSIVIMLGALDGFKVDSQVFSYEGPFGVGYLTAGFIPHQTAPSLLNKLSQEKAQEINSCRERESIPVKWARLTLENYISKGKPADLPLAMQELLEQRAGAFVSLKRDGQLRGCIGTIEPVHQNLAGEIQANAISAGTADPRFMPVEEHELDELVYSVDILSRPQSCTREDLDPKRYGVIVSAGGRRGLLLPDLEGVDTADKQLQIALQKAGIKPNEAYKIERFQVIRYY